MNKKQNRSSKNHSKNWMVGIAAASASTAAVDGAIVRITLVDNQVASGSEGGLSIFSSDLTGGGSSTLYGNSAAGNTSNAQAFQNNANGSAIPMGGTTNISVGQALYSSSIFYASVGLGNSFSGATAQDVTSWSQIRFSDPDYNAGAVTYGWINVTARNADTDSHFVILNEIMFDDSTPTRISETVRDNSESDPSLIIGTVTYTGDGLIPGDRVGTFNAVPEPTSISLLALGGAGVLLRRQRKKQVA